MSFIRYSRWRSTAPRAGAALFLVVFAVAPRRGLAEGAGPGGATAPGPELDQPHASANRGPVASIEAPPFEPPLQQAPPREEAPPVTPAPPPPTAYSLPWQLRPLVAGNVVRSDTAFASYEDASARNGFTVATTMLVGFKVPGTGPAGDGLAPVLRFAAVSDSPPAGAGGFAVVNPLVGASYVVRLAGPLRAAAFLGMTLPVGMGGGNTPDPGAADARNKGVPAREAMDNALFAVNDLTVIPGIDIGYVQGGFTAQLEATVLQLQRVRGAQAQPEDSKTNLTAGLHLGWFASRLLSLGVDLHYQQWLKAPLAVQKDPSGDAYHNVTFAVGPRFHLPVTSQVAVHPGASYARALDKAMNKTANYDIVQLDVPVTF